MHIGRHPMNCWFLIGIELKIGMIFIEIFLALTAKISIRRIIQNLTISRETNFYDKNTC
jgi:hypothetical protein